MPDNYLARYVPLLIQFLLVGAIAGGMVILSWLLGKHKPTPVKQMSYECGMIPLGDARQRFSVKFYLVAMLFILFDVEAIFLYPWAVLLRGELKMFGFWEMLVYVVVILGGFFYIWKKGALDWTKAEPDPIVALADKPRAGSQ